MEPNPKKQKISQAQEQPSSSSSRCLHYDIFLSFRGEDTRNSFTAHLKKGLEEGGYVVFRDDEGLLGKEIKTGLPEAIQKSKSSIVVLSKDYASSGWCLNELVDIMKRHTQEGYHVMPVFYHTNPSDVRNQKNSFADSFVKHERTFKEETVKVWREALTKIGGLGGIVVGKGTKETDAIKDIVKMIGELIGTRKYQFLTSKLVGHGFERAKDEIWCLLMKDDIDKIGVYGMGGVGKTTLMRHIYNQLQETSNCYWVTVSQDFSIYKLQSRIAKVININISVEDDDVMKRAAKLKEELTGKQKQKFILVLDDLWDDFDTKEVGLPVGPDGCKLVFTTRSYEVCRKMDCKEYVVKVEPLWVGEAVDLFKKEIENTKIDDEALVKSVVRECAGLPLAIKVMAKSMKGVDDVREWRSLLTQLQDSKFTKNGDIGRELFAVLRWSYDRLEDPSYQECFRYCALFPEDFEIGREELIELLICEGIIEEGNSRQDEVDQGHSMLNKLERLCLLEGCRSYKRDLSVKMHDLIRDVALQELRDKSVVMVEAGKLRPLPDVRKWREDLCRASFIDNDIKNIPSGYSPCCPHLSTLLLNSNWRLGYIGDSFFEKLNGLKILDLSRTGVKELPCAISNLERLTGLFLRSCGELTHVPSLAKLQELKALDLYGTPQVPQGLASLHNLRYLNMSCDILKVFPTGILPNPSRLQFLGLHGWTVQGEEVGGLRNLEVLRCGFQDLIEFNSYLQSQKHEKPLVGFHFSVNRSLRKCEDPIAGRLVEMWECDISRQFDKLPQDTEKLALRDCNCPSSLSVPLSNATELKSILIDNCDGIECLVSSSSSCGSSFDARLFGVNINAPHQVLPSYGSTFIQLKKLHVYHCHGMKMLFPLGLLQNLKNLGTLHVVECEGMEEIIASGEESGPSYITSRFSLPKLKWLALAYLPRLTSICDRPLICESLQNLSVYACKMLKKMPIAAPLPSLPVGSFDSTELLEQFKRNHPTAKVFLD